MQKQNRLRCDNRQCGALLRMVMPSLRIVVMCGDHGSDSEKWDGVLGAEGNQARMSLNGQPISR
jgi:hypothetical protein